MKVVQKWIWPAHSGYCRPVILPKPVVEAAKMPNTAPSDSNVVEVRDHVVGVMQRVVDAGIGQHHTGDAAHGEQEDEADRPHIGTSSLIEPPHMVAIQLKIFTPVGTAITIVAATK